MLINNNIYTKFKNVFSGLQALGSQWPDPEPIKYDLLPVMPFPMHNLPAAYQVWVNDVSTRMQCPPDYVAVAAIVVTSALIGTSCGIKPKRNDDWVVTPNLWGGIIGRPGMLKTPAVSEVMHLVQLVLTS